MSKKSKSPRDNLERRSVLRNMDYVSPPPHPRGPLSVLFDFNVNKAGTTKEEDRLWFEGHPDRSFRIRRIVHGEIPFDTGCVTHLLIRKVNQISREKRPVPPHVAAADLDALPKSDAVLESLWKVLSDPKGTFTVRDVLFPAESAGGSAH